MWQSAKSHKKFLILSMISQQGYKETSLVYHQIDITERFVLHLVSLLELHENKTDFLKINFIDKIDKMFCKKEKIHFYLFTVYNFCVIKKYFTKHL